MRVAFQLRHNVSDAPLTSLMSIGDCYLFILGKPFAYLLSHEQKQLTTVLNILKRVWFTSRLFLRSRKHIDAIHFTADN